MNVRRVRLLIGQLAISVAFACNQAHAQGGIEWGDNLFDGYKKAIDQKRPLVVLFTQDSPICNQLDRETIRTDALAEFGERAVYVRAETHEEDVRGNYQTLRERLKIDMVPALAVLEAGPEHLKEVGRITGYQSTAAFAKQLDDSLQQWEQAHPDVLSPIGSTGLPKGWKNYRTTAGRCRAALPGAPTTVVADNELKQYLFATNQAETSLGFALQIYQVPAMLVATSEAEEILASHARVLATELGGVLGESKVQITSGRIGRRFEVRPIIHGDRAVVQSVLVGNRVYALFVVGPEATADEPSVDRFFKSFQVWSEADEGLTASADVR